ncbi:alpha/beta fold hydrolase [Serpentinicella sp. ANB-PHB4]|uniref:alpha/beta fold hydrolase n=1 Tax=Serpentinicella sp. ANB-PHB4 TaxID=3074076 RepID=UPI002854D375|nr:alpha/beta fold hydrolase [Serpentinicella sp. ANB-PHB4]MDR5659759.1 alpha/beta fold hydrolase [Serpentinicella sp. ANB-PHB4]
MNISEEDYIQYLAEKYYFRFSKQLKGLFKADKIHIGTKKPQHFLKLKESSVFYYPTNHKEKIDNVFIAYATINKPYILDLYSGNSLIEYLNQHGYDIFLFDWGIVSEDQYEMSIEDQILSRLFVAIEKVKEKLNIKKINLIGYCQGGTYALMLASLFPESFNKIVLFNTPVDFTYGGVFHWTKFMPETWLGLFPNFNYHIELTDVPDYPFERLVNNIFKNNKTLNWLKPVNRWENDAVPMARNALHEWIIHFYKKNDLINKRFYLDGKKIDLEKIKHPVLSIVADNDDISPKVMSAPIKRLKNVKELCIPGGHLSTTAGCFAKYHSWPAAVNWLKSN